MGGGKGVWWWWCRSRGQHPVSPHPVPPFRHHRLTTNPPRLPLSPPMRAYSFFEDYKKNENKEVVGK